MINKPAHITLLQVPVLVGAPEELVRRREVRNVYETNRDIKTWSAWFLLKAITTSGHIRHWLNQKQQLQQVLQCNDSTVRSHIKRLNALGALRLDAIGNIRLCSYEQAAKILQIPYKGKTVISYDYEKQKGNQAFAYSLRVAEIQNAKETQLGGLLYHINENPELSNVLQNEMDRQGYDVEAVEGAEFQQWLLKMQMHSFRQGSAIYKELHARRADINRSVTGIADAHCYKSKTSVSYMKKILKKYRMIKIKKTIVESLQRCRKFFTEGGTITQANKWNKARKSTLLVLCDDIIPVPLAAA